MVQHFRCVGGLEKTPGSSNMVYRNCCFQDSALCSSTFNHASWLCREIAKICMRHWKTCYKILIYPPPNSFSSYLFLGGIQLSVTRANINSTEQYSCTQPQETAPVNNLNYSITLVCYCCDWFQEQNGERCAKAQKFGQLLYISSSSMWARTA